METKEITALQVHSLKVNNYTIREETFDGKKYLVVPVVMMREGVHNGSAGPIYHDPIELQRHTAAWNGIPVTIDHPEEDGLNVSANSPRVLERSVGRIFNTRYDDGLKAEAWIDIEKITRYSTTALAYIRQGRPLDVSVGVFTDEDSTAGQWGSETYESIARNYRPDHLALLPDAVGACSWADGCGIRVNKEGGKVDDLLKSFKDMAEKGYVVSPISNAQGYNELLNLIRSKLDSMDNDERIYFLEEVYDDSVVYRVRTRDDGGGTLYQRKYTVEGNAVTFDEQPVEVRKEVTYVTMRMRRTKINNNEKQGGEMSEKKDSPCCEAKVDALIANKATQFTTKDREWLLTQEEAMEVIATFKGTLKTVEDYTALMPAEMQEQISEGVKLFNEHRAKLVKSILDNTEKDLWKEDDLTAMETAQLEKVAKSIKTTDYSGMSGGRIQDNHEDGPEPLLPVGVKSN